MPGPQTGHPDLARLVMRLGFVSLFADLSYEGSHAILGSFLAVLQAGPLLVGLVAGAGELLGSGVRLVSGQLADRTHRYWSIMAAGYVANLLAVPALAIAQNLGVAIPLIFAERLGKGLRTPARNVVLAQAGERLGAGKAFGLHGALDQIGGLLGPLIVAGIVAVRGYRAAFAFLLVPAAAALVMFQRAHAMAPPACAKPATIPSMAFAPIFYGYMTFAAFTVMGFAHFILFSYHLSITHRVPPPWIPALYAVAMAADGLAAMASGRLFHRAGLKVLYLLPLLLLLADPLQFLSRSPMAIGAAAVVWGAALGVQDGTLRAGLAHFVPAERRGSAFGLFDAGFGFAWMIGSLAMGALYRLSPRDVVIFGGATELIALGLLTALARRATSSPQASP